MARPTICSTEIVEEISLRIADGQSLRSICADDHMPVKSSVLLWVVSGRKVEGTEKEFSDHYHAAREAAGYSHADEALDLRNELREGLIDFQSAKVILDALKWGAERMAPKRHSPRQEITGPDGGPLKTHQTISATDPLEAARQYQEIMGGNE